MLTYCDRHLNQSITLEKMSLPILIILMGFAGVLGGSVNYLLPANRTQTGLINTWWHCVTLGFGATLLVPLFLEIAQSKLLDDLSVDWPKTEHSIDPDSITHSLAPGTRVARDIVIKITPDNRKDSASSKVVPEAKAADSSKGTTSSSNSPFQNKNYLLFIAYCLVAASAGYRFINMLISNVVKEEKIIQLQTQNETLSKQKEKVLEEKDAVSREKEEVSKEKEEILKSSEKRTKNSLLSQQLQAQIVVDTVTNPTSDSPDALANLTPFEFPTLPPIINIDDPQKGRFGGKAENNGRRLSAKVNTLPIDGFFEVTFWVESKDPAANPLSEVIFYIHDSFTPSVYSLTPNEFTSGKAEDNLLSYGAFTIGVVTDGGRTLLELDLSEDTSFPLQFREQ